MSASKRKGTAAETAVVTYLVANGFPYAERRALAGALDKGDVTGIPGVVIEVKNHATFDLAGWISELMQEMNNARAQYGTVVAKRRGTTDPGQWYAIMPFELWVAMLRALDE